MSNWLLRGASGGKGKQFAKYGKSMVAMDIHAYGRL
jgi:hypothetical protein